MVYDIADEDVLEVVDVRGWRAVYAVETAPAKPALKPIALDFEDDAITAIRQPPPQLLSK